jgi:TonB family protein
MSLFFLPLFCFSQGVKVNVYDKFIKKHRIELEPVVIYSSPNAKLALSFSSVASTLYVQVSGSGWGASIIDDGNELIFLFSNDSTVTVKSTSMQTFEAGIPKSTYKHQYLISFGDLQALSQYELIGIRKYSFKEFADIAIQKENKIKVQKLTALFSSELKKANVIRTLKQINLQDVANYVGDSVMFCSKIYTTRYYESSDNKPTVLDVQSNFTDPIVNVVILEEDRKNFNDAPEKAYLNKDVCITGVVTMRNNIPNVVVHKREQIKVKSPVSLEDVALFIDDTVTVNGRIFTAKYFSESATLPTLLNMGAAFPDQPLTVVIEKDDRQRFENSPELFYLNKEVSVTGKVVLFKNKPQIVVRSKEQLKVLNKEQIKVLNDNGFITASSTAINPVSTYSNQQKPDGQIEVPAQYPGGKEGLLNFLNDNLTTPEKLEVGEQKTVVASFFVNVDGSINNIRIVKSAGKNYDNEVVRVLKKMPRWKPKHKGDFLMGETLNQPITFKGVLTQE